MKHIRNIILILLISVLVEIFACNFNHFKSLNYKPTKYDKVNILVNEKNNKYIEINNINKDIKNLVLNIEIPSDYISYNIYAEDEGKNEYYKLPTRYYYKYIEKSKYVSLNLSGKAKKIKIEFLDSTVKINNIEINKPVPLDYSITRQILIFLFVTFIYIFKPNSEFYKYKLDLKKLSQKTILVLFFIAEIFIMTYTVNADKIIKDLHAYSNQMQYYDLTIALSKKQVYLDREPSEEIKNMKNPYDYTARQKLVDEKKADFAWDTAYYKGKYYVYFGVVPVVTTYLPIYLLTHKLIPNYLVVLLISIISMFGIFLLLKEIVKRYFKETKLLVFILILGWLINTCGLLSILGYATIYNIPILYSIMFISYGLYFWLSSIKDNKISNIRIFLGSLCMALVAGCRPQLLISSLFALPIFWNSVFKDRKLLSKESITQTIMFILPYIIVAIPLMYYNYLRFGSIANFGANYNITSNDMTRRGFVPGRIGLGLFSLFFQLPSYKAVFPFLISSDFSTNYMGTTIREALFGGVFVTNVLLLISLGIRKFKDKLPKKLYIVGIMSIIMAIVIAIIDVEVAGVLTRYISDFEWLLCIPTVLIILSVLNSKEFSKIKKIFLELCIILIILSLLYQFLYMFDDGLLHDMINTSPKFYFKWYYLIQFWL